MSDKTVKSHGPSLPLNEAKDEFGDLRSLGNDKAARVFDSFLSHSEGDFDDEMSDAFKENRDKGELAENGGSFQASDFWFVEDLQLLFNSAIQPFRSRLLMLEVNGNTDLIEFSDHIPQMEGEEISH